MAVTRFEDLRAWQLSRRLAAAIYNQTRVGPVSRDFPFCHQIRRAAISIQSNIAEGFERNRPAEFSRFLSIAKASCGELRSQLYVAYDIAYFNEGEFESLLAQADEVARIIRGLQKSVERHRG